MAHNIKITAATTVNNGGISGSSITSSPQDLNSKTTGSNNDRNAQRSSSASNTQPADDALLPEDDSSDEDEGFVPERSQYPLKVESECGICYLEYGTCSSTSPEDEVYIEKPLALRCGNFIGTHCQRKIMQRAVQENKTAKCPFCRKTLKEHNYYGPEPDESLSSDDLDEEVDDDTDTDTESEEGMAEQLGRLLMTAYSPRGSRVLGS